MREIKFRVFSSGVMTVVDSNSNMTITFGNSTPIVEIYSNGGESLGEYGDVENTTIMQYTGLKDKNGLEIYEGDIVDLYGDHYKVSWTNECYSGKWGWDLLDKEDRCHEYYYGGFSGSDISVIGNIYENPELLEGKSCQP